MGERAQRHCDQFPSLSRMRPAPSPSLDFYKFLAVPIVGWRIEPGVIYLRSLCAAPLLAASSLPSIAILLATGY